MYRLLTEATYRKQRHFHCCWQ